MKVFRKILFLLLIFCFFHTNIFAQQYLTKKITIVAKKQTLKQVLSSISGQSEIYFSYSSEEVNDQSKITLIARKQTVENIVKNICQEMDLRYAVVEKQIVLKPLPNLQKQNPVIIKDSKVETYTVSGFVKDSLSKEVLIGATIYVNGTKIFSSANSYGFYSISLPKGEYSLQFSFVGYQKKQQTINLTENNENLSVDLKIDEQELKIITINNEDNVNLFRSNPLKNFKISSNEISAKPLLGGGSDAIKSLQSVPGFSLFGEGSVMFNVRGGDKGQNEIIVDEAPVYNPSHILGFFSAIAPEAINSMSIYKSNFPVQHGSRLSSLVDIQIKDGNMQKMGFSGEISPILSTYSFDGPIKKDKLSFYTTLRKSNINYLFKKNPSDFNINFYDFHFKINFKPSRNNRYFFSAYTGYDNIQINNAAIRWQNNTMIFRWNHLFSDKLFSNTIIYSSLYRYFFYYSLTNNVFWSSDILNFSAKQDYTFYKSSKNKLFFGFETKLHSFNPGNLTFGQFYMNKVFSSNVWANNLYFGGEYKLNDKLAINYGLRYSNWNNFGPTKVYTFDNAHRLDDTLFFGYNIFNTYNRFVPRISFIWLLNNSTSLSFAYDHNVQFLHYLSNSISPFTTIDFWMPSDLYLKPQSSNQITVGFFSKMPQINFSVEIYAKKMNNQVDYSNQPDLFLNPYFESQLRLGQSYGAGLEVSLVKSKGDFKFIISYSYSKITRITPDVNSNQPYPALWDKPNNLYTNFSYDFSDRFSINMSFVYVSGNRFSSPTAYYYYMNYSVPVYEQKNNDKLPDYHRMDLALKWRLNKKSENRYVHFFTFSIYNLYGHKNIIGINFNKIETENGNFVVPSNYISENELVSTSMTLLGFIPSISYEFKFR